MALWEGNRAARVDEAAPRGVAMNRSESNNLYAGVQARKAGWELGVGSWELSQLPIPNSPTSNYFAGGGGAFFCSAISEFQFFSMLPTHAL